MKINVHKLLTLDGHRDCVYGLEIRPDASTLYSAAGDGFIVSWDLDEPKDGQLLVRMKNSVYSIHMLGEENLLVAGQNYEGLHFIDLDSRQETGSLKIPGTQFYDFKNHAGRLFAATGDGMVYVIDVKTKSFIKKIRLSDKSVRTIAINDQLGHLAVGLSDNTIRILDLYTYEQKYSLEAHRLSVFALVYDPVTQRLISASRDAHIRRWDSSNHYELHQDVAAHMFAIHSLAISPDANYMVSSSMDKTIKVWDLQSLKLLKVIDRSRHACHSSSVNKVLWSTHKNQVISCSDDKNIMIWDLSFIY